MPTQFELIAPGFGGRLKEERLRLKLNQSEFAQLAGVQRLAQSQYESEARAPNMRYLSAIGAAGVSLYYLLFAGTDSAYGLSPATLREIERRAFELIEEVARIRYSEKLSAEGRYVLFEVIRADLTRAAREGRETNVNILDSLIGREARNGQDRH